jgi:hypothetical protein
MKNKFIVISILIATVFSAMAQPPKPPTDEEKLKHVSETINKEITLTAAQKAKVESAYKEFFADMEKLRKSSGKADMPPPPPPPPGKKEDVDKLVKARDEKIKSVLSEAQFKKYSEVEKTLHPPRPEGPPPPDKKQ